MKKLVCVLVLCCLVLSGCGGGSKVEVADSDGDGMLSCTLTIRCDTILDNMDQQKEGKDAFVPDDGLLLETGTVEFEAGDTVLDLLKREIIARNMHFEYTDATAYSSVYVEGICNLYEFDCGAGSGWEYCVNGVFPGIGCDDYILADGDEVIFAYTCDFGADVGDSK